MHGSVEHAQFRLSILLFDGETLRGARTFSASLLAIADGRLEFHMLLSRSSRCVADRPCATSVSLCTVAALAMARALAWNVCRAITAIGSICWLRSLNECCHSCGVSPVAQHVLMSCSSASVEKFVTTSSSRFRAAVKSAPESASALSSRNVPVRCNASNTSFS